jgi:hypothetical protein
VGEPSAATRVRAAEASAAFTSDVRETPPAPPRPPRPGSIRIVVSGQEAPIILVNLV